MANNWKKLTVRLPEKRYDKLIIEAEECNISQSDLFILKDILADLFISRGDNPITPEKISERILGLQTWCSIFKKQVVDNSDLNFLIKQNNKMKEKKNES